jgi:hypothetical protein
MERTDSGLYVARSFNVLRMRATERLVTLRDGRRAKVTVDDSGTVTQIESDEQLDAIVRPKTVRLLKPFGG